jgi:hypothetical protein
MFSPRTSDSFEQWTQDRLGNWLTPQQILINESLVRHRYTAVPSCHAAGKSRYSAMKVGHFIDSHPIGQAFVVSTAPTSAQVESVLWRELQRVHAVAGLRGRLTRAGYPQWHIGTELVAYGRRPTEIASFQGIHERFILIVLEEADGIPEALWIAADTLASSGKASILAIGNPDSADSHFAKVIRPGSGWNVVRVDGLRTPNFTKAAVSQFPELRQYMIDHGIPPSDSSVRNVPPQIRAEWAEVLLNPLWVYERMQRWGVTRFIDEDGTPRWREPSLWMSKVRGQAPEEGAEGLIPLSWIEAANRRWEEWQAAGSPRVPGRTIFGCDVADSGKDETVMTLRRGHVVEWLARTSHQDTESTGARLVGRMQTEPNSTACVDAVGVGVGVVNYIRARRHPVIAFNGAASAEGMRDATGEFTFANRRSAAYWHLRELLDPHNGKCEIAFPVDDDLLTDLTIPKWKVRTGAVIEVEPKDSVVKRLRRSPDCGDAVVMTFWPTSAIMSQKRINEYSQLESDLEEWLEEAADVRKPQIHRGGSLDAFPDGARRRLAELGTPAELRPEGRRGGKVFQYSAPSSEWDL